MLTKDDKRDFQQTVVRIHTVDWKNLLLKGFHASLRLQNSRAQSFMQMML